MALARWSELKTWPQWQIHRHIAFAEHDLAWSPSSKRVRSARRELRKLRAEMERRAADIGERRVEAIIEAGPGAEVEDDMGQFNTHGANMIPESRRCARCEKRWKQDGAFCRECAQLEGQPEVIKTDDRLTRVVPKPAGPRRTVIADGREFEVLWDGT